LHRPWVPDKHFVLSGMTVVKIFDLRGARRTPIAHAIKLKMGAHAIKPKMKGLSVMIEKLKNCHPGNRGSDYPGPMGGYD